MTRLLYLSGSDGCYIREIEAIVVKKKGDYVQLDRSIFYPLGGGQPSDTGRMSWEDGEAGVKEVVKKGIVKHILDSEPPEPGTNVTLQLDWEKRFAHMKMHTAQHLVSGIIYDRFGARTVGNQIYADRSRIDFEPLRLSAQEMADLETECNEIITKNLKVDIYELPRGILETKVNPEKCNLDLIPESIRTLRIVDIDDLDICPCAGTHVRSLAEVGRIKMLKRDNKGKGRQRLTYELED